MDKTKVAVQREILRDVSQNFKGAEDFIKQRIEKICDRKIILGEEVFYFLYVFCVFSVIAYC